MEKGRTDKFLRNFKVLAVFYILNILLQFVSRGVFIRYLGSELVGLNSLLTSLIGLLNVAELGIAISIGYSLYRPLSENNIEKTKEIMRLFKYYYKRIGNLILILGIILSIFLPILIKGQFEIKEVYIFYYIYLGNCYLSYLFTYKQTLITADQKQYKIANALNYSKFIKIIIQIIFIAITRSFFIWLIIEVVFNILGMFYVNKIIDKEYEKIFNEREDNIDIRKIKKENIEIRNNIKNIFFHKIGGFIVLQTDSILISIFGTLKETGIYGNYMMIINAIIGFISTVLGGILPSIGNLFVEKSNKNIQKIFEKLYLVDNIMATFIVTVVFYLIDDFIVIWVGKEYLFEKNIVIIILFNLYIQIRRGSIDRFKSAAGIYWDIYSPLVEGGINLVCSVMIALKFGIIGVFIGTIISNLIIIEFWKPYILYKYGFKVSFKEYIIESLWNTSKNILVFCLVGILYYSVLMRITILNFFITFIFKGGIICLSTAVIISCINFKNKNFKELIYLVKSKVFNNIRVAGNKSTQN